MKKYKIGYAPGVYDLFHIGHLNLIRRAKEQSEYLIVGVLSDDLVKHFKGKYPYIPLKERMEIVGALKDVDQVVEVNFDNTVKMDAWKLYHYDAYFSGSDHGHEWDREKQELQAVGSDIVFFPYTDGTSSTILKRKLSGESSKERIYILGAGVRGLRMLERLSSEEWKDKYKVEGFLDNSSEKHLTRIKEVPVYYPEELERLEAGTDYTIIPALKDFSVIEEQINGLGLSGRVKDILTEEKHNG